MFDYDISILNGNDFRITQFYGQNPAYYKKLGLPYHIGIDFVSLSGKDWDIESVNTGEVVFAGFKTGGYGNVVIIRQDDGYTAKYMHLDKVYVKTGQRVDFNTVLGVIGNTGNSTGRHLHLEICKTTSNVWSWGGHINPIPYLNQVDDELKARRKREEEARIAEERRQIAEAEAQLKKQLEERAEMERRGIEELNKRSQEALNEKLKEVNLDKVNVITDNIEAKEKAENDINTLIKEQEAPSEPFYKKFLSRKFITTILAGLGITSAGTATSGFQITGNVALDASIIISAILGLSLIITTYLNTQGKIDLVKTANDLQEVKKIILENK